MLAGLSLHEFGHVLAAYGTGGTVTDLVVFSLRPHVRVLGTATQNQEVLRAVAGSASSLLACFVFLLAVRSRSAACRLARHMATAFAAAELLGWSLSSLARAQSPSPDDAERLFAA